jgi:subtilisin-like proprotein convertase family protein
LAAVRAQIRKEGIGMLLRFTLVPMSIVALQVPAEVSGTHRDEPRRLFSASGPGGVIADGSGSATPGTTLGSTVTVPHIIDERISHVWVDFHGFEHSWPGDLSARLIHPSGKSVALFNRPGRGADNGLVSSPWGYGSDFSAVNSYSFSDNGTVLFNGVYDGGPFGSWQESGMIRSGVYRPTSNPNHPQSYDQTYGYTPVSFAKTFGGKRAAGEWTLEITDWAEGDVGSLEGWTLNICTGGCPTPPRSLGDEIFKLTAWTPVMNSDFAGYPDSMSSSRNLLAVGAANLPRYKSGGRGQPGTGEPPPPEFGVGSVHLFDLATGREVAMISPKELTEYSHFGASVGVSGSRLIVGAYGDKGGVQGRPSGSVHVYDVRDPARPVRRHKLVPEGATGSERWNFGIGVAINGDLGVVGAQIESQNGVLDATGTVFLFDLTTGEELARMTAPDFEAGDGFGNFLAIDGRTLIVGAPFKRFGTDPSDGGSAGAAYIFDVSEPRAPVPRHKLTASDARYGYNFGQSVAISGDLALVGSPWRQEGVFYPGAAYLFDVTTGEQLAQMLTSDPLPPEDFPWGGMNFGWSVGINGTTAVVGAPFAWQDNYTKYHGAAHVFDLSNSRQPVELLKLGPSDGDHTDFFGWSVHVDHDRFFVGAPQNFNGFGGKAFLYQGRRP